MVYRVLSRSHYTTMKQSENTQKSRIPKGLSCQHPIPMRLSEEERGQLESLAAKDSRSISSMARLIFLRGMAAVNAD